MCARTNLHVFLWIIGYVQEIGNCFENKSSWHFVFLWTSSSTLSIPFIPLHSLILCLPLSVLIFSSLSYSYSPFLFQVSVNVETSFCHLPLLLFSYLFIYVKPIIFHNVCNLGLSFFWVINNLLSFHCIVTKMTFSLFMDILCVLLFLTSLFILFW